MSLNYSQCRMARAALALGVRDLAEIADVSPNTIARLERGEALHARTLSFIRGALEAKGVVFIEQGGVSLAGGTGIRLGDGPKTGYAKLFERFWALPDLRRQSAEALTALTDVFELYLDIIEGERREPDVWERLDLSEAISGLANKKPHLAYAFLSRGITPPDNQSDDYPISKHYIAQTKECDLAYFRRCLVQVRASICPPNGII